MRGPTAQNTPTGDRAGATRAPISERPAVVSRTVGGAICCCNSKEHNAMIDQDQAPATPAMTPAATPAPTAGIDSASSDHPVAIVDPHNVQQDRFIIDHWDGEALAAATLTGKQPLAYVDERGRRVQSSRRRDQAPHPR